MISKSKNYLEEMPPNGALSKPCPLGKPDCLEHGCYLFHAPEDWQGCSLRLAETVMKDLIRDVAHCLDDMMGLSRRGKPK